LAAQSSNDCMSVILPHSHCTRFKHASVSLNFSSGKD
jgi:hypothetical protein